MEQTPWLNPTMIVSGVLAVISLIVWLVRLEGKTNTNAGSTARIDAELTAVCVDLETHKANQDIHFNLRMMQQVEKGNEQRFHTIETQLSEINRKLDNLAGRA